MHKKVVLPNETNLNIHFYLNLFYGPLKKRHIGNLGVFFGDFAQLFFVNRKKSVFHADPNVPIPGSYTAVVRKLRENFFSENFIFGQNTGARKLDF